ncbi:hypothetical protein ESCOCK378M_15610 [Escherichia coli]
MTSLKTSIKTITYLSDIGCLEIQGASLQLHHGRAYNQDELSNPSTTGLLKIEEGLSFGDQTNNIFVFNRFLTLNGLFICFLRFVCFAQTT